MEEALIQVGLPVSCAWGDCEVTGYVKPAFIDPKHGGWYKSKLMRRRPRKMWYCPGHYEKGRELDNRFYENYKTPDPYPEQAKVEQTTEELYNLID